MSIRYKIDILEHLKSAGFNTTVAKRQYHCRSAAIPLNPQDSIQLSQSDNKTQKNSEPKLGVFYIIYYP